MKLRWLALLMFALGAVLGMQGCVYSGGSVAPTVAVDPTQALQTVQALLTATSPPKGSPVASSGNGSDSATPSPSLVPTTQPTRTPSGSSLPATPCDLAAAGSPIDVTIPDDTNMEPGQAFTKIWKLENAGSCTWGKDYAAVFFYGDMMSALEVVPIASAVEPGQSIEIAVEMVAPIEAGSYQGNWKLRNADGVLFGIGPAGDSPFWVRVNVSKAVFGNPTATSLPTFTPTPTEIPSPTPIPSPTVEVAVQGQLSLEADFLLDLDMAQVNPIQGADLAYRTGSDGYHWLIPQGEALLGVYGSQPPELQDCQLANASAAPVAVESLPMGIYLCYQTAREQIGWLHLLRLDSQTFALLLEMLTWTVP